MDRISDLLDGIIHHIFSTLPTKDFVQSSILSKRWKNLWRSAPTLEFNQSGFYAPEGIYYFEPQKHFYEFVDTVLSLREGSSKLKEFSISFRRRAWLCYPQSISNWILYAIARNVRVLYLKLGLIGYEFPSSMFTCRSLVKLTLLSSYDNELVLPTNMDLPALKFLSLASIRFPNTDLAESFFAYCPLLETLSLDGCFCSEERIVSINALNLKNLTIASVTFMDRATGIAPVNLNHMIKVYAPNLISFTFTLDDDFQYQFNFPSVVNAKISMGWLVSEPIHMLNALSAVPNAQTLELSACCLTNLMEIVSSIEKSSPIFSRLKCIKLEEHTDKNVFPVLLVLLKHAPNIESLDIEFYEKSCHAHYKMEEAGCSSMFNQLKSVAVRCFNGYEEYLEILQFFLEKSAVLEKVVIYHHIALEDSVGIQELAKFGLKLSTYPRISSYTKELDTPIFVNIYCSTRAVI